MENNLDAVCTQARTSLELVRFAVDVDNKGQRSQIGAQRGSRAAFIFDPAEVWGSTLAELLGHAAGGSGSVNGADIADSLRLCAIKFKAGDRSFVLESLAGQSVILAQLMAEAVRDYSESEANGKWQWARIRLREFQQLQKAHMRTITAIAGLSKKH